LAVEVVETVAAAVDSEAAETAVAVAETVAAVVAADTKIVAI